MILLATAGPATALLLMLALHLFFPDLIDPMTGLLSDYAVTSTMTETIFALGMMALAAGCVATAWTLTRLDPPPHRGDAVPADRRGGRAGPGRPSSRPTCPPP